METIYEQNVAEFAEENFLLFSANCAYMRYIPFKKDGLKPVQRRILTSLHNIASNAYIKTGTVVGDTMGKYHPHGDTDDAIKNMTTTFDNNIPLIQTETNFGSIKGNGAASIRYTEIKLSNFAKDCFFRKEDVPIIIYKKSYNGKDKEPIYLPTAYPVMLVNGCWDSITKGFNANTPSYNFKEVCETTIKLIKNPDAPFLLIPDVATKCAVIDNGTFESICEKGIGTLTMESTYEIDYNTNSIIITSLPYNSRCVKFTNALVQLKAEGKIEDIKDFTDETNEDPDGDGEMKVNIRVELQSGVNPQDYIKYLMSKKTYLRRTSPINIQVVDNYEVKTLSVREVLVDWIEDRRTFLRSKYKKELTDNYYTIQLNKILITILDSDNIEKTINIARSSRNREDLSKNLIAEYGINSIEADSISKLSITGFTQEAREKYIEELKAAEEAMEFDKKALTDSSIIDNIIIAQLKDGIKKYGGPRKSPIISRGDKYISNNDYIISISRDGYLKKELPENYGDGNRKLGNVPYKPFVKCVKNKSKVAVFDTTGNMIIIKIKNLPETDSKSDGIALNDSFGINGNIVQCVWFDKANNELFESNGGLDAIILTEKGYCKRTNLSTILRTTVKKPFIRLEDGDQVSSIQFAYSYEVFPYSVIMYTDKGNGIHINGNDLRDYQMAARGLRYVISDDPDEKCVGLVINFERDRNDYLLFVLSSGKCKRTSLKLFAPMQKRDRLLNLTPVGSRESIISILPTKEDEIGTLNVTFLKAPEDESVNINDVPITTRVAKSVKMFTFKRPGDRVINAYINK